MQLNENYLTHTVDGVQMMVSVGEAAARFNGIAKANKTAAFLVKCLEVPQSEDTLVRALAEEYEVDPLTARQDVQAFLLELRSIGALDE